MAVNKFTSDRKMMSIAVKRDQKVYVYAKGAESQIITCLSPEAKKSSFSSKIEKEVYSFGS